MLMGELLIMIKVDFYFLHFLSVRFLIGSVNIEKSSYYDTYRMSRDAEIHELNLI